MAQPAKKLATYTSNHRKSPFIPMEIQKTKEKILKTEHPAQMSDSINGAVPECIAACSDNLCAYIESGSKTTHAFHNIGSEVMECCNRTFSDFTTISKEAIACRSMNDIVGLRNEVIQLTTDNYFRTINKLTSAFFNCCSQLFEPIGKVPNS